MNGRSYVISADGRSITCRRCGMTSHHGEDVRQRYCPRCHIFHEFNGKELSVVRLWVFPGHEEDFNRQPVLALVLAIIDAGMGVIWDMAPDKSGQALSRLLLRQDGELQMGPPTPENQMRMNFAERYWRSRMARP